LRRRGVAEGQTITSSQEISASGIDGAAARAFGVAAYGWPSVDVHVAECDWRGAHPRGGCCAFEVDDWLPRRESRARTPRMAAAGHGATDSAGGKALDRDPR